ncbi:hypothetical protein R3P38DRAFT_2794974 [Favolaschia claudopus]|uniref:Uncharacterized protein n=1 Tax=Favolaschia claudopus TaxID=2862362 RepID=A0AAW0A887_9AGAR
MHPVRLDCDSAARFSYEHETTTMVGMPKPKLGRDTGAVTVSRSMMVSEDSSSSVSARMDVMSSKGFAQALRRTAAMMSAMEAALTLPTDQVSREPSGLQRADQERTIHSEQIDHRACGLNGRVPLLKIHGRELDVEIKEMGWSSGGKVYDTVIRSWKRFQRTFRTRGAKPVWAGAYASVTKAGTTDGAIDAIGAAADVTEPKPAGIADGAIGCGGQGSGGHCWMSVGLLGTAEAPHDESLKLQECLGVILTWIQKN